jgi:hypothetical protein
VILTDQAVLETIAQRWKKENKKRSRSSSAA